jgi:hypothetical protein
LRTNRRSSFYHEQKYGRRHCRCGYTKAASHRANSEGRKGGGGSSWLCALPTAWSNTSFQPQPLGKACFSPRGQLQRLLDSLSKEPRLWAAAHRTKAPCWSAISASLLPYSPLSRMIALGGSRGRQHQKARQKCLALPAPVVLPATPDSGIGQGGSVATKY